MELVAGKPPGGAELGNAGDTSRFDAFSGVQRAVRRVACLPLWAHALALAALLLFWVPYIGRDGLFVSDEGAVEAQVGLVAETGAWTTENPAPVIDPEQEALPMAGAEGTADGRWAPYVKQPGYVAVLVALDAAVGTWAATIAGVGGTAVAALTAGLLAGRARPGLGPATLWATGAVSPLAFDAHLTMAHAPAAALAGCAVVAVAMEARSVRPRAWLLVLAAVLVGCGALLRAEAVLFGLALAVGAGWAHRRRPGVALAHGLTLVAAAATGWWLNKATTAAALDGERAGSLPSIDVQADGWLIDRLRGMRSSLFAGGYSDSTLGATFLVVGVGLALLATVVARRHPQDRAVVVLAVAATAATAMRWVDGAGAVPGLFMAFPLLAVGWAALGWRSVRAPGMEVLVPASAAFAAAVVATQYSIGGGVEWGGRYFAVGLPAAVPVAVVGLADLGRRLDRRTAVVAGVGLGAASVLLAALGAAALRSSHDTSARLADAVRDGRTVVVPQDGVPTVVANGDLIGRLVWRPGVDGRWFTADEETLGDLSMRLDDAGVDAFTLVSRAVVADLDELGPAWRVDREIATVRGWRVVAVVST